MTLTKFTNIKENSHFGFESEMNGRVLYSRRVVPPGQKVNQRYYIEISDRLRKRVNLVRPIISNWILHDILEIFFSGRFLKAVYIYPSRNFKWYYKIPDYFLHSVVYKVHIALIEVKSLLFLIKERNIFITSDTMMLVCAELVI